MRFYRTYQYKGKEQEVSCDADDELDAETEFFYIEQEIVDNQNDSEFEWTSPIYDLKTKIESKGSEQDK